MNILAVDDGAETCGLLTGFLAAEGYTMITASTTLEAMATILIGPVDVVLLHLPMLPAEERQFAEFMAANGNALHVSVIVISRPGDEARASWSGMGRRARTLKAPLDPAELLEVLQDVGPGRSDGTCRSV
jgi:DNA-binding response OmpR family regulator